MSKRAIVAKTMTSKHLFAQKAQQLSDVYTSTTCSFIGEHNGDHYLLFFKFNNDLVEMTYTQHNSIDISGIKFQQQIWISVESFLNFNITTITEIIKQFHQTVDYHQKLDNRWRALEAEMMQVGEEINQLEQNNRDLLIRLIDQIIDMG